MSTKKIYLSSPHMGGKEKEFIDEAFKNNWIAPLGTNVDEFEREVSEYIGVEGAVATVSGTSAIHMALKCVGVKTGDIVFCSSLTFAASCNPIIYENAIPVFIDSDLESWNMSPIALERAFKKYKKMNKIPKAVIVVDLYGESAKYDEIRFICNKYNVPIIEDSAEALGSEYKNKKLGSFGDLSIFSFNGNKIITTSGGGMLLSNNINMIKKAKFWITQSRENKRYYEHKELGYNYRMSNVLAGIGRGQMRVIDKRVKQKRDIYNFYSKEFKDNPFLEMKRRFDDSKSNEWLSCVMIRGNTSVKPVDIIEKLEKNNIEARHIWKPMHLQPFFKKYDFISERDIGDTAEKIFLRGICLPSDTKNTEEDMNRIIGIIKEMF